MEFHLRDAFKLYRDLPHQNQAINVLEQWLKENHPEQIERFHETWSTAPLPELSLEVKQYKKGVFHLPGYSNDFYLEAPIIAGGSFTWAEATANGDSIPKTKETIQNIITLAEKLQVARNQIGKPFHIASWYHTIHLDAASRGQQEKHHVSGDSVDFWVDGYTNRQLAEMLNWWSGGMGTYTYVPYMINLDIGVERRWQAGYPL